MDSLSSEDASSSALPKAAFLGPLGTYSHQCAHEKFGENAEYVEQPTIAAVFDIVSDEIPYGVVPQQNSTFGSVTETYDNLRRPAVGSSLFVRGDIAISIQHCLAARPGVKPEEITRILSHEQALGQCTNYLSRHYPNATRRKVSSTGRAAEMLLESDDTTSDDGSEMEGESAAICSTMCAKMLGLEILQEGIQDRIDNFTRFYVLSSSLATAPPYAPRLPEYFRALVRLGVLHVEDAEPENLATTDRALQLVMSTLLTTFGVPVTRINRRPSLAPIPFEDVYFIELEELGGPPDPKDLGNRGVAYARWLSRVQEAVKRAQGCGIDAVLLGAW